MSTKYRTIRPIGLAVIGCGKVGRIRAELARKNPGIEWIGLCDIDKSVGQKLSADIHADYFTEDYRELLKRSEVNAVIVATFADDHVGPINSAIEWGHSMLIEKPIAPDARDLDLLLNSINSANLDVVLGYTQRFRRRFITAKEHIDKNDLGDVTSVTARAYMNRNQPLGNISKMESSSRLTPMVISGTHSVDLCLWFLEGKKPVEVYARSGNNILGQYGIQDVTFAIVTFDDGTIYSMNINWALPEVWPGAVYSLDIGMVGSKGVLTIDDTHRDLVLATETGHGTFRPSEKKNVSFLTSYPPGDRAMGQFWGPMREETRAWFDRISLGDATPHTTASEAHENLMLCMAMDLSAKIGEPVKLPVVPDDFY